MACRQPHVCANQTSTIGPSLRGASVLSRSSRTRPSPFSHTHVQPSGSMCGPPRRVLQAYDSIPFRQPRLVCHSVPEQQEEGPLDGAVPAINRWFNGLTAQQKAYTVVAVATLLYLLPKAFLFFVVGLERMFIGLLMEVEEVVVQLIFRTTALGLTVGLALLACAGIYVFLAPPEKKQ